MRPEGNEYVWTDQERRETMFAEVSVRWHAKYPDTIPVELHAYEDNGVWRSWVFRNEWNRDYGNVGVTLFSGKHATRSHAEAAARSFIANYEHRTLTETANAR